MMVLTIVTLMSTVALWHLFDFFHCAFQIKQDLQVGNNDGGFDHHDLDLNCSSLTAHHWGCPLKARWKCDQVSLSSLESSFYLIRFFNPILAAFYQVYYLIRFRGAHISLDLWAESISLEVKSIFPAASLPKKILYFKALLAQQKLLVIKLSMTQKYWL